MAVLRNGDIQIIIKKNEIPWLLEWVNSIIATERDSVKDGSVPKEYIFYAEKLKFVLKGGNLERSRFSRKRQTETCPLCEREFTYLHRHVCTEDHRNKIDHETLMRI